MVVVVAVAVAEVGPGRSPGLLPFSDVRRSLAVLIVVLAMPALPAMAGDGDFPQYTGSEFQMLYEYAVANTLPNLEGPNGLYTITGNEDLDKRIWELALERGYVVRPAASGGLVNVGGVPMQPQAAEAWIGLRAEARDAGLSFVVSSAYRSPAAQRAQFLSKLGGDTDAAIDSALAWYSVPGTSKHHGGYALDFRYKDGTFAEFRNTPDYAWLKEGNFAVPMSYGLIPSYPDDVTQQGPNPEPWEFVWVGTDLLRCGLPQPQPALLPGPVGAIVGDIARCPGGMGPATIPQWISY